MPNKTGVGNKHPRNWDVSSIFSHFPPFLRQCFPSFHKAAAGGRHKMSPILFAGREGILTTEMYNVQVGELTPSFPFLTTEAPQSGRNRREDSFPSLCQFLPASPHNWETGTAIDGENFLKDRLGEGRDLEDHFLPFITIWMAAQNFHQVSRVEMPVHQERERETSLDNAWSREGWCNRNLTSLGIPKNIQKGWCVKNTISDQVHWNPFEQSLAWANMICFIVLCSEFKGLIWNCLQIRANNYHICHPSSPSVI